MSDFTANSPTTGENKCDAVGHTCPLVGCPGGDCGHCMVAGCALNTADPVSSASGLHTCHTTCPCHTAKCATAGCDFSADHQGLHGGYTVTTNTSAETHDSKAYEAAWNAGYNACLYAEEQQAALDGTYTCDCDEFAGTHAPTDHIAYPHSDEVGVWVRYGGEPIPVSTSVGHAIPPARPDNTADLSSRCVLLAREAWLAAWDQDSVDRWERVAVAVLAEAGRT